MKARLLIPFLLGLLGIPSVLAAGPIEMLGNGILVLFEYTISLPHSYTNESYALPIVLVLLIVGALVGLIYAILEYSSNRIKFLQNRRVSLIIAIAIVLTAVWSSPIVEWIVAAVSILGNGMSLLILLGSLALIAYIVYTSIAFASRTSMEAFMKSSEYMDKFNGFLNERRKKAAEKIEKKLEGVTELNAAKFKQTGIVPKKVKDALGSAKTRISNIDLPTQYTTEEIIKTIQEVLIDLPQGKLNAFVRSNEGKDVINEAEAKLRELSNALSTGLKPHELELIEEQLKNIKKAKFWKSISPEKKKELEEFYAKAVAVQRQEILVQLQTIIKTLIARLSAVMANADNADSYIQNLIKETEGLIGKLKSSVEAGIRSFQEAVQYQEVLENEFENYQKETKGVDKYFKKLRAEFPHWGAATPTSVELVKDYLNVITHDAQKCLNVFPHNPNFKEQGAFISVINEKLELVGTTYTSPSDELTAINRTIKKLEKDPKFNKTPDLIKEAFDPLIEKEESTRKTIMNLVAQAARQMRNTTAPKDAGEILSNLMSAIANIDFDIKNEIKKATKDVEDKVKNKGKKSSEEEIDNGLEAIADAIRSVRVEVPAAQVHNGPSKGTCSAAVSGTTIQVAVPEFVVNTQAQTVRKGLVTPNQPNVVMNFKRYIEKAKKSVQKKLEAIETEISNIPQGEPDDVLQQFKRIAIRLR